MPDVRIIDLPESGIPADGYVAVDSQVNGTTKYLIGRAADDRHSGLMTASDKSKLDKVTSNASRVIIDRTSGGVRVIVMNVDGDDSADIPTKTSDIDNDSGYITFQQLPAATDSSLGMCRPDNVTTTVSDGVMSAVIPTARLDEIEQAIVSLQGRIDALTQ